MRNWLFHPLIFYPLVALAAAAVIALSIQPQSWPRAPAPVAGVVQNGALVLEGAAFNSPEKDAGSTLHVDRDYWGHAQSLHIALKPGQAAPVATDTGVRILLGPESAAFLAGRPATVEVTYRPQPVNTAAGLAVSLQGAGPAQWVTHAVQPQAGVLKFELPGGPGATAIGLRAMSSATDQAYGLEIVRIRAIPR